MASQGGFREDAHFKRGAGAAVEHDIVADGESALRVTANDERLAVQGDQARIGDAIESFDRIVIEAGARRKA